MIQITPTALDGVVVIEPQCHSDIRGYFYESYSQRDFDTAVRPIRFVQDNQSSSALGVLRGLHFQLPPYAQSKLVRAVVGQVFDVAVDVRLGSPTFGKWVGVLLSEQNLKQLFVPRGFAHGFLSLSPQAVVQYKCDNFYRPECEQAIAWNDPDVAVQWPLSPSQIILSDKDKRHPNLRDCTPLFHYNTPLY